MKRILMSALVLAATIAVQARAQSLDELGVQLHGYATQGFLYTTNNNIFTTNSSNGSPQWTEAVLNVSLIPLPKLSVTVQARYSILGDYGNNIIIDYAMADYKASDRFGVRFGKVKTPIGLFNEIQDIDPSYLWTLLPQGIYPITSRNSILSHYGGVVYGKLKLSPKFGALEYRAFGGEGYYAADDGYFVDQAEAGYNLPNGIKGTLYGGALRWKTPISGLMAGVSALKDNNWTAPYTANSGTISGSQTLPANTQPNFFAIYDRDKIMIAYEYSRNWGNALTQLPDTPDSYLRNDDRSWYVMASYKLTGKLTAGAYYSYNSDHQADLDSGRYSHDTAISARYDFNLFLYAKAEQHFIQGTGLGYDDNLNPNLQPNTALSALKVGVTF